MELEWPGSLALLVVAGALLFVYVFQQRRRQRYALRYASLSLIREAIGPGPGVRRHIPAALFLLGFAALILALARPVAKVQVPALEGTIVLAIDVSGSMLADDIQPTRMDAAKQAAITFVERQRANRNIRVGVVSFSDNATIVALPSTDRDGVIAAIERLKPLRSTAIGRAIIVSLDTVYEGVDTLARGTDPDDEANKRAPKPQPTLPPAGEFAAATVVLLTDGENNQDPPPLSVIDEATRRGVRVYTVGVGTPEGALVKNEGRAIISRLDEDTLKQIAEVTHARYFSAASAADLQQIYENLATQLVLRPERRDITVAFAAGAAALFLLAGCVSLLWFHRLP